MPTYRYTARDERGREAAGLRATGSYPALVKELAERGLTVTSAEEVRERPTPGLGRIGVLELAAFYRQLADIVKAGAPLAEGLRLLAAECANRRLGRAIDRVRAAVEQGVPLSEALGREPRVFGRTATNLARAGERSGALAETLTSYAEHLERFGTLRHELVAAMTYPAIVSLVAACIVVFLLGVILQRFVALFEELGIEEFPLPTQILVALSEQRWVGLVIVAVCLGILVAIYLVYRANQSARMDVDALKLRLPIVGRLWHAAALAQLSSTLAVLVRADVPLVTAMELAGASSGNGVFESAMQAARRAVRDGHSIARGIGAAGVFPPTFVWRASVGEATGQLAEALESMAAHYQHVAQQRVRQMSALIEPLLIIFLGIIVGSIIAGMFMPLLAVIQELSG